jgi:hypothetical protein
VLHAIDPVLIGLPVIRYVDPSLTGTGVRVAEVEAPAGEGAFEVNPAATFVAQSTNLFTYVSSDGTATNFPNNVGSESGHADSVGGNFFGTTIGVAPGVSHVDNYEANYFYNSIIAAGSPPVIPAKVVNQSFNFTDLTTTQQRSNDSNYDDYADQNNTLFISGVGGAETGGRPNAPSTSYNGIGVGAYGGNSSVGPTLDNGRSKPDITAPDGATSFSTPLVSGAATILLQAALRGDAGTGSVTNAASDIRTVKALLLNGAMKPTNWTHTATAPLDTRFGAGILNVFNSYEQLAAGKFAFVESTTAGVNNAHPPGIATGNIASLTGWDFNTIASTVSQDRVSHYYLNLPQSIAKNFTLTATLVWNRAAGAASAKNLDLFLYNASNSNRVASSVSTVDNVEHLYVTNLAAGRYDLQVMKTGDLSNMGTETYALAFSSFAPQLAISKSGTSVVLSWPLYPNGFKLQLTANLDSPITWSAVGTPVVLTNNQNVVVLPASGSSKFFRLVSP